MMRLLQTLVDGLLPAYRAPRHAARPHPPVASPVPALPARATGGRP
jgi:hypothetical protein